MNRNIENISENTLLELSSLCNRLVTQMTHTSNEFLVEDLANLYSLCMITIETFLNYSEISNMGAEGKEFANLLGFDVQEKMMMIDDKISILKKNGVSLLLH